jgi:hypothetical protein
MAQVKDKSVGVKQLADKLGTTPYELRKVIRSLDLGVGRGTRYAWPSMQSADVKKITRAYEATQQND